MNKKYMREREEKEDIGIKKQNVLSPHCFSFIKKDNYDKIILKFRICV